MPVEFGDSFWDKCWARNKKPQPAIRTTILAAGFGKRLEPFTARYLPKPMFPLGGKLPMVEVWVRRLVESGLTDISMNVCVLSETIKRHFGNGARFCADISYVEEEAPTGTLGGVCKQALGRDAKTLAGECLGSAQPR